VNSSVPGAAKAVVAGLWAPRTWRATLHVFAGLMIVTFLAALLTFGGAADISLIVGPTGAPILSVLYVLAGVVLPVLLVWALWSLSTVQRARFRNVLGVEIPRPAPAPGRWPRRLALGVRTPAAWRRAGYHLLALAISAVGGIAVTFCWSAVLLVAVYPGQLPLAIPAAFALAAVLLLAAPWVARGVVWVDTAAARALLGPGRREELAQRVEALSRSRAEVIAAADAERRRIERDLHDGAQQQLLSLAMNLGMARSALAGEPGPALQAIEQAHEDALAALTGLRELVRGLHPAVLNDRGLNAALSGIVARAPLPVRLRVDVPGRCTPSVEAIAYFTVSEALTNIAKHAQASHAEVTVTRSGARLLIVITDDGVGGAASGGAGPGRDGSGLRGLAQRAAAADGTLQVDSPVGGPTTITMELPCE
jgi:signal transduction histidine kinase